MLDGKLFLKNDSSNSININDLMKKNNQTEIVEVYESKPSKERNKYAFAGARRTVCRSQS